ncbi:MAG: alanine dehydrogenase [Peptococcaceae bacterium]|nr:alanine dehydrogenase [Peptococcaceae bacterium]
MIVGVPKEIKNNENRVGITPAGVQELKKHGHKVMIEQGAGLGSGIADEEFAAAGAHILEDGAAVYAEAEMVLKVKEPLAQEYGLLRKDQVLFTYLHLAPNLPLTKALLERKTIGIAYETVELPGRELPLLTPMSMVAGRMSVQIGAHFLEKSQGGAGILLAGTPGVKPAKVTVVGGGMVGTNAARLALGLGAEVTVIDVNGRRLAYLDEVFGGRIKTVMSNSYNIAAEVKDTDLLIGAVLIPGARAPKLVTEAMVKTMKKGSVIVDVAIDQGGSIETIDRITTHTDPVYEKYGVLHYAVANIPGNVAKTSTYSLVNATLPYALKLADRGWRKAVKEDQALTQGVNTAEGKITYQKVAEAHGMIYIPLEQLL